MPVKVQYITLIDFNEKLKSLKGRLFHFNKPSKNECLCWDVYWYQDAQMNFHLLYKDIDKTNKKKSYHYAFDPINMNRPNESEEENKQIGRLAFKKAKEYANKYNEELDYPKNKEWVRYHDDDYDIVCSVYYYESRDFPRATWIKHCYGYDMNSCYPYFLTKPLPYGDIIRENDIVGKDEIGFIDDISYKNKRMLKACFEGEYATYIFKAKIYKGLSEFAYTQYELKKTATDEERDSVKQEYNALVGIFKYHNIFIRSAVLGYAERYIKSLRDENTIIQTVDSIVSSKPRNDLDIGTKLGQFKVVNADQSFIFNTSDVKRWAGEPMKKKGLKPSKAHENFEIIKCGYEMNIDKLKIIKCKIEWSRLWPDEDIQEVN